MKTTASLIKVIFPVIIYFAVSGFAKSSLAATIIATSCSQADVQAAIDTSTAADIVSVPAGICTWSSGVIISKGITLKGAGTTLTILTSSAAGSFFSIPLSVSDGGVYQITGFGLTGSCTSGKDIAIDGNPGSLRVDYLRVNTSTTQVVSLGEQSVWDKVFYGKTIIQQKVLFDHIEHIPASSTS